MTKMRGTSQMITDTDRGIYEKSYRKLQRVDACVELLRFFDRHARCAFEISGRRMTGRAIADNVCSASDARLRLFHAAAQQHRRKRGRRS